MSTDTTTFTTTEINHYNDVYNGLPLAVTIGYMGVFAVAFIVVAIYAMIKLKDDKFPIDCTCGNWFGLLFDLRKIYLHAVIHTADTVSDLAVIAQFWRLAYREQNDEDFNVEGLDMMGLFIGTVAALGMYRLFTAYHFFYIAGGSILLFLLQFLDFGVYLAIYLAWKLNRTEPIFWQDYITHVEALFESIPQILIQSQFVLRTGGAINNSIVVASIVIAFVSVVTRFVKSDWPFIHKDCHQILLVDDNLKLRAPYISWGWFAINLLRVCEILTRLVCGVFLWAVLGFIPLAVVLTVTMIISQRFLWKTKSQRFLFWYIAVPLECVVPEKRKHIYVRCLGNWTYLTVITIYSFMDDAWCETCPSADNRNNQINPNGIEWSLGYLYLFIGWICSILTPILWFTVIPSLYIGKKATPETRREEIMALPRMFYRKRGCYKPTVTPLHFAVHRRFTTQIKDMLHKGEVDINAIRISGATALHSAVGRSLRDVVEILLKHGAEMNIVKKEVWYFRCCMPWKWCGRNWYEGKTALEIARFKVQKEMEVLNTDELDDEHRYKQILDLLENPPPLAHPDDDDSHDSRDEAGRTDNVNVKVAVTRTESGSIGLQAGDNNEVDLVVTNNNTQVMGNSEDALMDDMVMDDVDAEQQIQLT